MRTLTVAAMIVAGALAVGACGDDDSEEAGNGGNGGGGGGGLYGEGGGGGSKQEAGGGGGSKAAGGGATTLRLSADPGGDLKFDKSSLEAKAGKVTIAFDNPATVPHAVEVEGKGVEEETETITDGSAKLTVDLEAGTYKFYCPVGNHEQAGMVGELTVR
jgi:plastocyanin